MAAEYDSAGRDRRSADAAPAILRLCALHSRQPMDAVSAAATCGPPESPRRSAPSAGLEPSPGGRKE
jgi:hypothetical protein